MLTTRSRGGCRAAPSQLMRVSLGGADHPVPIHRTVGEAIMLVAFSRTRQRWYQCVIGAALAALSACTEAPTEPTLKGLVVVQAPPAKAVPGWMLRDTITVRVVNDDGSPRPGSPVTWSVTGGGGTIIPIGELSDSHGLAMAVWTLGPVAGPNEIAVRASDQVAITLATSGIAFRAHQLAGGVGFACGLVSGDLWCWGGLAWTGTDAVSMPPVIPFGWEDLPSPGPVAGASGLTQVAVAQWGASVCALDGSGGVWCASDVAKTLVERTDVPPLRNLVGANDSGDRFCGLLAADSTAWCWTLSGPAIAVPGSPAFLDLDIDGNPGWAWGPLACGRRTDSTAACWGERFLGNGTTASSVTPVPVADGHKFAEVAVGNGFGCGRQADGNVWCWGANHRGQLNVPGPDALSPILAETGVTHLTASSDLVLAIKDGGLVHWGGGGALTPGPVSSLAGLSISDVGAASAECLSLTDGQVYCVEEMWDRSSVPLYDAYAPVQPAVGAR